ncbi:MAG: MotA/TolQ/ExbB proton channel family protein [gamma proteobacterium symbiont of Bathyaustriella thionipta]|nr:MotA/TolQ/ExbB proton channel family protein [gamma proteobacterium symbiont of Bathyaustriella thionipta]MCU7951517.1 MotA/TolQ/ExbB proton channel family protein [gamma proteobacterium symbiont of Bathyaustriella thionipta]MCU7958089.1 MotA/TolQ/ExbB proton channel family protein [gamma proteobacterium symbiont of Bathyaustriella thionipta]MCU7966164.1 MotA/TolQ/ExbB proton channel family protein [gamma proteobacterium symbiont of Bathyaustriella thionipta]
MNSRNQIPTELIYQIFSLLIAFIIVHSVYISVIRPQADTFMQQEHELMLADTSYVQKRNFYVVVKDYEQEACFILMIWALAIMAFKGLSSWKQNKLLDADLLKLPFDMPIGPEDTKSLLQGIRDLPANINHYLLPRALTMTIQRFAATHNVHDAHTAMRDICESEAQRLDTELSTIRYIAWAIPSIGFIGTVRGIGDALSQANRAMEGDITGVTESLGVAFNSTFIALVISIVLMFFIHQLQLLQERLVLDSESYCDQNLVSRLRS